MASPRKEGQCSRCLRSEHRGKSPSLTPRHLTDEKETIDIVRRAFPQLKEYADERIQLEVGVDGQNADQWSGFMDEAWPRFATQPPTRMKITVADAPGDAGKRELLSYTATRHTQLISQVGHENWRLFSLLSWVQSLRLP
jgi:hypothetical protein